MKVGEHVSGGGNGVVNVIPTFMVFGLSAGRFPGKDFCLTFRLGLDRFIDSFRRPGLAQGKRFTFYVLRFTSYHHALQCFHIFHVFLHLRTFWSFQNLRNSTEALIIHQQTESRLPYLSLSDMIVPVHARAQLSF